MGPRPGGALAILIFGSAILATRSEGSYMMVLGASYRTEVVSLDPENPLPWCLRNLKDLYFEMYGGAGAALSDGTPLACGTEGRDFGPAGFCYKYRAEDDLWYPTGRMINDRYWSGFAYNDAMGLVMAGGVYADENVESTLDGSAFQPLTPYPYPVQYHCLVSLDDNTLMSIGGSIDGYGDTTTDKAYIYKTSTNNWTEVASLKIGRGDHSCGVIDGIDGKEVVVVSGYNDTSGPTDSVEIYSVSDNTWRDGTPFPRSIDGAASVQFNGTFMVVGGYIYSEDLYDDRIYEYEPASETWRHLPVTLKGGNRYHTAFMVPKSIFPACGPQAP